MDKPETKVRVNLTIAPKMLEKLDILCREKGLNRPAMMAIAIDKLWKEEHPDWQ